jgi:thioredoxin reductase (NADPH)
MNDSRDYEIIIIGGGPAGLAAGLYAARARRNTLLFERKITGGQIALTADIENYPGIEKIAGYDLSAAMHSQSTSYGLKTAYADVTAITPQPDGLHTLETTEGPYRARAVIVTGGADFNRLGVPGEERLTGKGVSYCATCDAAFFRDKPVAVVGGGDAAMDEGLFVTRFASQAYMLVRRDRLRASAIMRERAFANPKMEFRWNTVVEDVLGDETVTGLGLRDVTTGERSQLAVEGVFIFIGLTPNSAYLKDLIRLDAGGHVVVNEWMETAVPGIFAAGDIRANSARQAITAAGDGATAAIRADHYLSERFGGDPGAGVWMPASMPSPSPAP